MSTQLEQVKKQLSNAGNAVALVELGMVSENWKNTYKNYLGRSDAEQRWEQEKVLILQALDANAKLGQTEPFSFYSAIHQIAMSGLSLREGCAYLVPYGSKCVFVPGWKGRLEQLNEMPDIDVVHEPQVVYKSDDFDFELGTHPRVIKHKPNINRPDNDEIIMAYMVLETKHGTVTKFLDREKAYAARNKSQTWKYWQSMLAKDGSIVNPDGTMTIQGKTGSYEIDPPLWVSAPADAWKKTITKRTYDSRPNKLPRHKQLEKYEKENEITEEMEIDANNNTEFTSYVEVTETEQKDTSQEEKEPGNNSLDYGGF